MLNTTKRGIFSFMPIMGSYMPGIYGFLSAENSNLHSSELQTLASDVNALYELPNQSSFLALTELAPMSGVAYSVHGLLGIKPKLLKSPEIAVFMGVHEAVHARLGHVATANAIDGAAPGYRNFFHKVLVPCWLEGTLDLRDNREYLESREYDSLVPGGCLGPHTIDQAKLEGTLHNYFLLVSHDLIEKLPSGGNWYHPSPALRSWTSEIQTAQVVTPYHYADRLQWLADVTTTGMELGETLYYYSRNNAGGIELEAWEEGLANRIASDLSGVGLQAVQAAAPQDRYKLELALRLHDANHSGQALAESVQSYHDLLKLVRSLL